MKVFIRDLMNISDQKVYNVDILNIDIKDPIEIFVDGEFILLKKYEPACIFCGNAKNIVRIKDKNVCEDCINELKLMK